VAIKNLNTSQCWVIKIGSALLTNNGVGLNNESINKWVRQIVVLRKQNMDILLVSSGSIAEGMARLHWQKRPGTLHTLQAAAAVGQMGLIQSYESAFSQYGYHTAQILLTHDDFESSDRCQNVQNTIQTLLKFGVVPVINENDTVATDEISFGDNDMLAAMVAKLVNADNLVILTDQDGLYDSDPQENSQAKLIVEADVNDRLLDDMAKSTGGSLGRGGMASKLTAARLAGESDINTVIANGAQKDVLLNIRTGKFVGSLLLA